MVLKSILQGQMTEKIAFEVRPKKGKKLQKVIFLKSIFWPLGPLGGQKKLDHMKFKSKISCLGKKISILPWQMAEQLAVEVNVKNVTDGTRTYGQTQDKLLYLVRIQTRQLSLLVAGPYKIVRSIPRKPAALPDSRQHCQIADRIARWQAAVR